MGPLNELERAVIEKLLDWDTETFHVSDVGAKLNGALDVGFVLFIRDGRLHDLEGFTYDDPWPDVVASFELFYDGTSDRRRMNGD